MKDEFLITETATVQNLLDFVQYHFPDFTLTIRDKNDEHAESNTLIKDLMVFKKDLPLAIKKGIEFNDMFVNIVTKTGLSLFYVHYGKKEVASYQLNTKTTISQILEIFQKHFPSRSLGFSLKGKQVKPSSTLKELMIKPFTFVIYDQYSSTRIHFETDSGLDIEML